MTQNRNCILCTIDGDYNATAGAPFINEYLQREVVRIQAVESSHAIDVYKEIVERKFECEDKPTFYAC